MTAWVALFELAKVTKDEKVLISPAAGGVGTAAVQLAANFGCEVYGLVGNEEKKELIISLGAKAGFNYREKDCFLKLKQKTGGVDVVVEMVGGNVYKESFNLLNPLGRIAVIGFAGLDIKWWNPLSWYKTLRDIPRMKIMDLAVKSGGVMASHLGYLLDNEGLMVAISNRLTNFINKHKIKPIIGEVFQFNQADVAHEFIESRKSVGKVLLEIE
jgi:NADPH2:quinone reductase